MVRFLRILDITNSPSTSFIIGGEFSAAKHTNLYKNPSRKRRMSQSDIWTEKYRPVKFEEVVGQQEILKRVKSLVQALNIPHLLFAGPAGIGKSTLALIIVKSLFGD